MNPVLDDANFVAPDIQERDVVLADGQPHKLKFKRLPGVEYYAFVMAQRSDDEDQRVRSIARLVSVSLVDADGGRVLSVDRAAALRDDVLNNLLAAANSVNQRDEKKTSPSALTSTSGT